ncbi:hypothetical protein FA95DRAFT_1611701 [Auriscalpium vulgare]|uniref:Uncharacterized protein n=1 Tax=Auriscalpium vulgare TaxID=40419 RepID=A0ACB8R8X5_9AGAM|nr:hypothetical protein FA95DRAFT_1611701 [Auriscalpium vulgare]
MSSSPRDSSPSSIVPFADATAERLEVYVNKIIESRLRKRKSRDLDADEDKESDGETVTQQYADYGRAFARLGEPFTNVFAIVDHGLHLEARKVELDGEDGESDATLETEDEQRLTQDWTILCKLIPGFQHDMIVLAEKRKIRKVISSEITCGAEHARADDSSGLKSAILGYLHLDITLPLDPPIPVQDVHKALRGWNHPATATLLTPIEWEANQTIWTDVLAGRRQVTAEQMPRLLYPEGHVFNPENIDDGLFRSHVLIRVAKHIFQGPSSALQGPGYKKGRAGVAKLIGMTKMTPHALAYVIVQARFSMSDVQEWHVIDRDFDYRTFFWNVVGILETDEGKATLELFDHEVFGKTESIVSAIPTGPSAFSKLKQQRAAKRARIAGPDTSASATDSTAALAAFQIA